MIHPEVPCQKIRQKIKKYSVITQKWVPQIVYLHLLGRWGRCLYSFEARTRRRWNPAQKGALLPLRKLFGQFPSSVRPSVPFLPPSASKHKFHVHPLPADSHPSLKLAAVAASRQSINIDILQRAKGTERGVQCLALTFGVSLCNSRNLHSLSLVCESIHDRPQLIAEAAAVAPLCATRQWMGMQNWAKGKTGERVRDG